MAAWCSASDVKARLKGDPSDALAQEYADQATSLLYEMTGRKYATETNVTVTYQIDRRGYVKLTAWAPVREIVSATIDTVPVTAVLSPGGTYAVFPYEYSYYVVVMVIAVGQNPPIAGKTAAAALAAEMLRSDSRYATSGAGGSAPDDLIKTPRPTAITRQGVTYTFSDPATLSEQKLTGVYEVDLFLRSANPNGLRNQPKVVTAL